MANTIVYFHTGRGGHFHNAGHVSFCGNKTILGVLQLNDDKSPTFLNKENQVEIYELLKSKDLDNLIELFENCLDNDDFTPFEKKTGLKLGQDVYIDSNGSQMITVTEVESGVGVLNWDEGYDTDVCMLLSECSDNELKIIANSDEWNKDGLLQEFFNDNTDLKIDWAKFDGRYSDLIDDYYFFPNVDVTDYYEEDGNSYEVKVISSAETKIEEFESYESAVTFYQEKCEEFIGDFEEISHTVLTELLHNMEGNGFKIELNFIN